MRIVALIIVCLFSVLAHAEEPFLKPNDVIAFIGGEDMVTVSESGYLELALTLALPDYKLKFRNLAKEGDTVYEQRRDLNFPDLAAQLDKAGATVVLCQFGKMECLVEGKTTENFASAYRNMIEKVAAGGKRRVAVLWPRDFESRASVNTNRTDELNQRLDDYSKAIKALCDEKKLPMYLASAAPNPTNSNTANRRISNLREIVQQSRAEKLAPQITGKATVKYTKEREPLLKLIAAKNKLWFHYTRPQNWAFLGGDRVEQPSSHDHINTSYRWFPVEMEEFLVLMAAKEEEIWKLAKETK